MTIENILWWALKKFPAYSDTIITKGDSHGKEKPYPGEQPHF